MSDQWTYVPCEHRSWKDWEQDLLSREKAVEIEREDYSAPAKGTVLGSFLSFLGWMVILAAIWFVRRP